MMRHLCLESFYLICQKIQHNYLGFGLSNLTPAKSLLSQIQFYRYYFCDVVLQQLFSIQVYLLEFKNLS